MKKLLVLLLVFCLCITVCGCELDESDVNSILSQTQSTYSTDSAISAPSTQANTSTANNKTNTSTPKKQTAPTVNEFGNSAANIHNMGYAVEHDGIIYYTTDSGIYKVDGTKTKKLANGLGCNLSVYDGWLYYLKSNNNNIARMCKMRLNGENKKTLPIDAQEFYIANGWIYYITNKWRELHRIKVDGTNNQLLLKDYYFYSFNITNKKIYWGDGSSTYEADLDGKNVKIYKTDSSQGMVIVDNIKYTSGRLTKGTINGSKTMELFPDSAMDIVVKGEWIYFIYSVVNEKEKCPIYKIKTDGTGLTKVTDNSVITFSVVGDWIYYMSAEIIIDEPDDDDYTWDSDWSAYPDGYGRIKIDGTNDEELD